MKRQLLTIACIMGGLAALADALAPSIVTNEATLWLDASALNLAAGTQLSSWQDVRGGGYKIATSCGNVKPQVIEIADGELAGKKAVTFFPVGTNCDMSFDRHEISTAFVVCDIDVSQDAYLLGDTGGLPFGRGTGGNYGADASYRFPGWQAATAQYWCDGVTVGNPTTTVMPNGYHLYSYLNNPYAICKICQDRNIDYRIGGKRLCEVITFARALNIVERSCVEAYLRSKWFAKNESTSDLVGMKAQVHFDASAASSFHYEGEGDDAHVTQWDDLSGNGRNFFAYHTLPEDPKFGTRGLVNGVWAYQTGAAGSRIDMQLEERLTDTRSFFIVCDIAKDPAVYWLGDMSSWCFARGAGSQYLYNGSTMSSGTIHHNGVKVGSTTADFPDEPGGSSVYSFVGPNACAWQQLGTDRPVIAPDRNGGKQVSEMMTFSEQLSETDREAIDAMLMDKWSLKGEAAEAFLNTAAVHVDASKVSAFVYADNEITGWHNTGTGDDLFRPDELIIEKHPTYATRSGTRDYTNGVPAFLMGPQGSNIELVFGRYENIRSVFWAMDIEHDKVAFMLGDGSYNGYNGNTYNFCRNLSSPFTYASNVHAAGNFKNASLACDGVYVAPLSAVPPFGMHVFDLTAPGNLTASSLSQDRVCFDGDFNRNGGRALAELAIFTTPVTGLTRDSLRAHLQNKWTLNCAWAGAGDAEWGAGKYRVFTEDGTVSAEGASADGIGFSADATLAGGTLTLGKGGVFAAKGVAATVAAPIASSSPLEVNGPGTVALSDTAAVGSIIVGYGSTLKLPVVNPFSGALAFRDGAKLVLDVSDLPAGQYQEIPLESLTLPAGAGFFDLVKLSDDVNHSYLLKNDGKTIVLNDPSVPVAAEWVGNGDRANAADPANWVCRNVNNEVVEGAVPGTATVVTVAGETTFNIPLGQSLVCRELKLVNVVLSMDCDWRGIAGDLIAGYIDLNGHRMTIDGTALNGATYTDTTSGDSGELHVEVVLGKTATNTASPLVGNLKLVKDGAGVLVVAKNGQTYTGGTEIAAGYLKPGLKHDTSIFGATGSTMTVLAGGQYLDDIHSEGSSGALHWIIAGEGPDGSGAICTPKNSSGTDNSFVSWGRSLTLADDAVIGRNAYAFDFHADNFDDFPMTMNGHTLTLKAASYSMWFLVCGTQASGEGTIVVGDNINFAPYKNNPSMFPNVTLVVEKDAVYSTGNGESDPATRALTVSNLVFRSESDRSQKREPTYVLGTYTASSTVGAPRVVLGDENHRKVGLNLSERTTVFDTALGGGLTFADGCIVTVDVHGHEFTTTLTQVASWEEQPAGVQFELDPQTAKTCFIKAADDGLYVAQRGPMIIYVR